MENLIGAAHGEQSVSRINQPNGYRGRAWETRVGTVELEIPKLRKGSYFPTILEPRRALRGSTGRRRSKTPTCRAFQRALVSRRRWA